MNNTEPPKSAVVGTATFFSKAILVTLKWLGIFMMVMLGIIVSLILGLLKKKV